MLVVQYLQRLDLQAMNERHVAGSALQERMTKQTRRRDVTSAT